MMSVAIVANKIPVNVAIGSVHLVEYGNSSCIESISTSGLYFL